MRRHGPTPLRLALLAVLCLTLLTLFSTSHCETAEPAPSDAELIDTVKEMIRQGQYAEAEEKLEKHMSTVPVSDSPPHDLLTLLVRVKFERGQYVDAMRFINRLLDFGTKHYLLNYYKGSIYAEEGLKEEALDEFNLVLEVNPNHIGSLVKKAMLLISMLPTEAEQQEPSEDDFAKQREALQHLAEAIKQTPVTDDDRENIGGALLQLGDTDMAEVHIRQALENNPHRGFLHYLLCAARVHNGDLKYKSECTRALELMSPDSQITYMVQGLIEEIEKMEKASQAGNLFHMEEIFHKGQTHEDNDRREL